MTSLYKVASLSNNAGYGAKTQGSVLAALPLHKLFGAPFQASIDAQTHLANSTAKFVRKYAMDICGNVWMSTLSSYYDIPRSSVTDISNGYLVDPTGGGVFASNTGVSGGFASSFNAVTGWGVVTGVGYCTSKLEAGDIAPDSVGGASTGYQKRIANRIYSLNQSGLVLFVQGIRSVSVPFISMVNVPALTIEEVGVEFCINIKTQEVKQKEAQNTIETKKSSNYTLHVGVEHKRFAANYDRDNVTSVTAVSTSKNSAKSDTSTESTYLVQMKAKQVDPVGLTAIMKFITQNKDTASKKTIDTTGTNVVDDANNSEF